MSDSVRVLRPVSQMPIPDSKSTRHLNLFAGTYFLTTAISPIIQSINQLFNCSINHLVIFLFNLYLELFPNVAYRYKLECERPQTIKSNQSTDAESSTVKYTKFANSPRRTEELSCLFFFIPSFTEREKEREIGR